MVFTGADPYYENAPLFPFLRVEYPKETGEEEVLNTKPKWSQDVHLANDLDQLKTSDVSLWRSLTWVYPHALCSSFPSASLAYTDDQFAQAQRRASILSAGNH